MQLRRSDLARLAGLGNDLAALNGVAALQLARRIIDGAKQVTIFGDDIPVRLASTPSTVSQRMPTKPSCWLGKSRPAQNERSLFTAK